MFSSLDRPSFAERSPDTPLEAEALQSTAGGAAGAEHAQHRNSAGKPGGRTAVGNGTLGGKCPSRRGLALLVKKAFRNRRKGEMHRGKGSSWSLGFFQAHFIAPLSLFSLLLIFSVPTLSSDQLKLLISAYIGTVVVSS